MSGIADSAVGKISSAIGSASVKVLDSAFTAGETALESAKRTAVGKVQHCNFAVYVASDSPVYTDNRREHPH